MRKIVALTLLAVIGGCSNPGLPRLRSARLQPMATPKAELLVIRDDGVVGVGERRINHLGSIVFLNEANDGPVTVTIRGDFSFRSMGDFPDGTFCLTVCGVRFEAAGATTPVPIPPGGIASTCLGYPGHYRYVVRVGDQEYPGELWVEEEGNPHPAFSEVSGS